MLKMYLTSGVVDGGGCVMGEKVVVGGSCLLGAVYNVGVCARASVCGDVRWWSWWCASASWEKSGGDVCKGLERTAMEESVAPSSPS
jgi:hypothetical protein